MTSIAETLGSTQDSAPEERIFNAAPLHHSFGFDSGSSRHLLRRSTTMYLEDEVSTKRLTKLLRDEELTCSPAIRPSSAPSPAKSR